MSFEHVGEFQVEVGLGLPLHTTASRLAYTPPQKGFQVFDTDLDQAFTWSGTAWIETATAADLDGKVDRAGDTMTGPLQFGSTSNAYTLEHQNITGTFVIGDSVSNAFSTQLELNNGFSFFTGSSAAPIELRLDSAGSSALNYALIDGQGNEVFRYRSGVGGAIEKRFIFTEQVESKSTVATDSNNTLVTKDYLESEIASIDSSTVLGDLTDVVLTTPGSGHVIIHDGTTFVNAALTKADISDFTEGDYVHVTGDETIAGNKTFSDDVTIAGDLVVTGTTTSVNSTDLEITDNKISINSGETGAGITHTSGTAGIVVERGTETNSCLVYEETDDAWKVGLEGGDLASVATSFAVAFLSSDWTTGAINTYVIAQATHKLAVSPAYGIDVYKNGNKIGIETSIDPITGDVTLTTVGAVFDGSIRIVA